MKEYRPCECYSYGFCDRHMMNKSISEYKRCLSDLDYRRCLDISYYGSLLGETPSEHEEFIKRISILISKIEPVSDTSRFLDNTNIFILGHLQSDLDSIKDKPFFTKINLENINYGKYSRYALKGLSESRFYLYDFDTTTNDIVGTLTASWNNKYINSKEVITLEEFSNWSSYKKLCSMNNDSCIVCANYAHLTDCTNSEIGNEYFYDLLGTLGILEIKGFGVWSNQVICNKNVMRELKEFMIDAIIKLVQLSKRVDLYKGQLHPKYDLSMKFGKRFENRRLGLLAEEISARWFAAKTDLITIESGKIKSEWY